MKFLERRRMKKRIKALNKIRCQEFHKKYKRRNYLIINASFELIEDHTIKTDIVGFSYEDRSVKLTIDGVLTVKNGFVFGASGLTIDSPNTREGSCVHDALYHISQLGGFKLTYDGHTPNDELIRKEADKLIRDICIKNGMSKLRAYTWYSVLRIAGSKAWKTKQSNVN